MLLRFLWLVVTQHYCGFNLLIQSCKHKVQFLFVPSTFFFPFLVVENTHKTPSVAIIMLWFLRNVSFGQLQRSALYSFVFLE